MKKTSPSIILLTFLILTGCRSLGPVFKEKPERMIISVPLKSFELSINDTREAISNRTIYLNPISFGGEYDSISAALPTSLEKSLMDIINSSKTDGEKDLRLEVSIHSGYQKFHFNGFHEVEYVEVELTVKAINKTNEKLLDQKTVKSWGEKKTFDATYKRINRMYLTAFRQAFKKALGQLEL